MVEMLHRGLERLQPPFQPSVISTKCLALMTTSSNLFLFLQVTLQAEQMPDLVHLQEILMK